jgi:hypothetical protein
VLYAILWEFLYIGIPAIIAAIIGWLWWRSLSIEEKKDYKLFGKRSRSSGGGSAVSVFFWIAFAIKIYLDGNWNVAISNWTLNYLVYSSITVIIWIAIIFGIPAGIIGLIYLLREVNKKKSSEP